MSGVVIALILAYVALAIIVGMAAFVVVDPYRHESRWRDWLTVAALALLWPLLLVWLGGAIVWNETVEFLHNRRRLK